MNTKDEEAITHFLDSITEDCKDSQDDDGFVVLMADEVLLICNELRRLRLQNTSREQQS